MACANHTCTSGHACTSDCPLCHSAAYCSEQCRVMDWVKHDCKNVVRVESPAQTVYRPYYHEDRMSEQELGPLPELGSGSPLLQSYMGVCYGPDHTRIAYPIPALIAAQSSTGWLANVVTPAVGDDPSKEGMGNLTFEVRVYGFDSRNKTKCTSYYGKMAERAVYRGNDKDPDVSRLLGNKGWTSTDDTKVKKLTDFAERQARKVMARTGAVGTSFVLWPPIIKSTRREFNAFGELKVELYVGSKLVTTLEGGYDLRMAADLSKLSSAFKSAFQTRLKGKFESGADRLFPLRAIAQDVIMTATFNIPPGGASGMLMDIEVVVPVGKVQNALNGMVRDLAVDESEIRSAIEFRCNPRSADSLIGLALAAEHTSLINERAAADESFQNNAAIVRQYARHVQDKLACVAPADVPMEVNTAVRSVVDALYAYNVEAEK